MVQVAMDPRSGLNGRVAARLRGEARARRMTYAQLAEMSGLSQTTIQRYLAPSRAIPIDALDAICKALGVEVADILLASIPGQAGRD